MNYSSKDKNSIKNLFNKVAKNYDILNNFMSFGMQKFIKTQAVLNVIKLAKNKEVKILDLCTGTGDISILFKQNLPESEVIGIDFSEKMLKIAKSRIKNVTFLQADITDLSSLKLEKKSFDICFISFGLRNLPNIDEFLQNIKPYLKNDGILSILDLGKPKWYMKPYFYLHYNILIPFFAFLFNQETKPYQYFIQSSKTYPSQQEIIQKLTKSGYKNIQNKNFAFGIIAQQIAQN